MNRLTIREKEVAIKMGEGLKDKEIGKMLNIQYGTVRTHVNAVTYKLGFTRRITAVKYILSQSK